jgi:nucleoside-triphosphatase
VVLIKKNVLITGLPGIGKTTLIKKLVEKLQHGNLAGFYTEEIRTAGIRRGFSLVNLDGRRSTLSHVDIQSRSMVGKYGVDVKNFEDFLDDIAFHESQTSLIIIDEIGRMECFSDNFKKLLTGLLDSEKPVIATIALRGEGIIGEIKKRKDVQLFVMTKGNRELLCAEIMKLLM